MKRALASAAASLLLAASAPALADMRASFAGYEIVLRDEGACPASVLRHVPEGRRGFFRPAAATKDGERFVACWERAFQGNTPSAHIQYEDGDRGLVPLRLFAREERT